MPDKLTDKEIFENEIKCIQRRSIGQCNGGTDCCKCDLLMNEKDIISAYERAIANNDLINRLQCERNKYRRKVQNQREEINRLQAEIERLKPFEDKIAEFKSHVRVEDMLVFASSLEEWLEFCDNLKAEAYKEFVDLLKAKADELQQVLLDGKWAISQYDVDKLLKEKIGSDLF